ncbi:DMT family transporter [Telmatospirillum sp. J64-1]|uniref:DMT family transporter n=1 Tax=Telmatospirillum sp. J64-1 TaxID=2502183 RepID=UPI00115D8600|nr:DMT family transporter [Telmatospirillum sp. J64-1]
MTNAPPLRQLLASPYLLLLVPPLLWAGNTILGRIAADAIPPLALSFWRWMLALLIVAPIGLPRVLAQREAVRRHWLTLLLFGATSVGAYNTFLYIALHSTTAINAMLVNSAMPVLIVALSWLWLGEALSLRQWGGVLLSLSGVVLVITQGQWSVLMALELRQGDLVMLLAAAAWAIYSVALKRKPTGLDPMALLTLQIATGLLVLLPFYLWELSSGARFETNLSNLGIIAYVAVFPSLLAYYFWNRGVGALGANVAGQYIYLLPVFTAVLAVLLLGETFGWYHGAGLGLIFIGIWIATLSKKAKKGKSLSPSNALQAKKRGVE